MKNKINMYYAKLPNMGDLLNVLIIKKCFGYDVTRHTYLTGELGGIGSGLGQFTLSNKKWLAILQKISGVFFPKVYIWGTGFISYNEKDSPFYRKGINIVAVRGELSKMRVEKILGRNLDIPTGDAGILATELFEEKIEKKYSVGIIPHFKEKDETEFKELVERFEDAIYIDVMDDPMLVIQQIAECENIISSSLHGLVVADAFHIPNLHVKVTENLLGDGFKFDDYYSAYGLKHEYIDLKRDTISDLSVVRERYKITMEMVEEKKKAMLESFPYPSIKRI